MSVRVRARVASRQWAAIAGAADLAALARAAMTAAANVARARTPAVCEVNALFCDDAAIRELNLRFRGQDKATNVLSFPSPPGLRAGSPTPLGDIAIAAGVCLAEAAELDKAPRDHVAHLLVHGFLHLVGYDHESAREARAMETAERAALASLAIADPYAGMVAARRVAS